MELTGATRRELGTLQRELGAALHVTAQIDDSFDDPIRKDDRFGEVAMVIRRPNGKVLIAIKTFYPRGAYRLPTGGIHHGESVREAALRETREETGLQTELVRFLAHITYRGSGPAPLFHTFAFLFEERGGTLGALDLSEQIEDWREIAPGDLPRVADFLDHLTSDGTRGVGGSWRAWGKFRAVVHRAVYDALTPPGGRTGTR